MKININLRVVYIENGEFLLKAGDAIIQRTANIQDITAYLFKMGIQVEEINASISEALLQVRERMGVLILNKDGGHGHDTEQHQ